MFPERGPYRVLVERSEMRRFQSRTPLPRHREQIGCRNLVSIDALSAPEQLKSKGVPAERAANLIKVLRPGMFGM